MQKSMSRGVSGMSIIVPVYNGYEATERLLESLWRVYAKDLSPSTRIFLIDDASPDARVAALLRNHPVCALPTTSVFTNDINLGFIGTVNRGFALAQTDDVIILNSDTEIFSDIAREFRRAADFDPRIATITPMTNCGTLASVVDFPEGNQPPLDLTAQDLHSAVQRLSVDSVLHEVPTGVGFCMYISRVALDLENGFDPEFGKGYGEECDFCRRIAKRGFKNVLAPGIFVYHQGSQSFGNDTRLKLIAKNSKVLLRRHPEYNRMVEDYFRDDPTRIYRFLIVFNALIDKHRPGRSIFHLVHSDIDHGHAGGTERHLRQIFKSTPDVLHLGLSADFRNPNFFRLSLRYMGYLQIYNLKLKDALYVIDMIKNKVGAIHIHHTKAVAQEIVEALLASSTKILFTAHDYYLGCPVVNLLTGRDRTTYCGPELDTNKCNTCLASYYDEYLDTRIHRRIADKIVGRVDAILFPSDTARTVFDTIFPVAAGKSFVVEHDLKHLTHKTQPDISAQNRKLVVFLGAIGFHKGAKPTAEAARLLINAGYEVEIWGSLDESVAVLPAKAKIINYFNLEQLASMFDSGQPAFYVIPSLWPETFCYAFFEGLFLSDAIPIVTDIAYPGTLIRKFGGGIVVKTNSARAILDAVVGPKDEAELNAGRARLRANLREKRDWKTQYLEFIPSQEPVQVPIENEFDRHLIAGYMLRAEKSLYPLLMSKLKARARRYRALFRILIGVRAVVRKLRSVYRYVKAKKDS